MLNQYVHVRCEEYSLLIDIRWVEEVINTTQYNSSNIEIEWRQHKMPFMDLTEILMGHAVKNNRHCIILKDSDEGNAFLGVGVGQVANIETIKDEEFEDLPSLDFPFNDYFDKAYIPKTGGKCIYRLKNLVQLKKGNNDH
jgi:chemotaxis signal transduction protein